jgi:hypothetical protein
MGGISLETLIKAVSNLVFFIITSGSSGLHDARKSEPNAKPQKIRFLILITLFSYTLKIIS